MKKYIFTAILALLAFGATKVEAQEVNKRNIIDSLTTIDPDIKQYFPRWKLCEGDLQVQIHQSFIIAGYEKANLDRTNIEVLAAPKEYPEDPYEILMISCGSESMNSLEMESNMGDMLLSFLSGESYYTGNERGYRKDIAERDYCYTDIPITIPLSDPQKGAIVNFLEPSDADHAITASLFEQALKIGDTGFWLKSKMGNDEIGYHFWSAGEGSIQLKRPFYKNMDQESARRIPYLINGYMGGDYRISSGLGSGSNSALSWVPNRMLNSDPGGKIHAGFDFHMPFLPEFGVAFNMAVPLKTLEDQGVESTDYFVDIYEDLEFNPGDPRNALVNDDGNPVILDNRVPLLRGNGQVTLFYNWWLDKENPENYIRVDLGVSYAEIQEASIYYNPEEGKRYHELSAKGIKGLKNYHNSEAADWIYAKAEYRNSSTWPFGFSVQYSNQILLSRVYVPLLGDWLYLEAKYSTPLRDAHYFERENFFMISPVIRLSI